MLTRQIEFLHQTQTRFDVGKPKPVALRPKKLEKAWALVSSYDFPLGPDDMREFKGSKSRAASEIDHFVT